MRGLRLGLGLTAGGPGIVAPVNTVAPVASGTARVGETLSVTDGTWTGTATITYTYQWRRAGVNIASATNSTYVLVTADVGQAIDCVVTATNAAGSASQDSNNITLSAFLDAVVPNVEFHLDATKTASYPGTGQTWANGVAAPASGAGQTDYDWWLGNDVNVAAADPTFTGSAGDPGAYFELDGGDFFRNKVATLPAFIKNLHKTTGGQAATYIYLWQHADGALKIMLSNNTAPGVRGIRMESTSGESLQFQQRGDTANVAHTIGALTNGADNIVGLSVPAGGGTVRHWLNAATKTESTFTFNPGTGDITGEILAIGCETDLGSPLPSGTRIYAIAMISGIIDDAEWAKIVAYFEHATVGHNRNYVA